MAFKDLFIKEETAPAASTQKVVQEVPPNVESIMPAKPAEQSNAAADKDIEAKIWDMIIAKNLPGPDYIEFKNAAAGLVDITPDESMQLKGAFNVLKRSYPTFSKDIILSSIDNYINIVNEEKEKGIQQCAELRKTKIEDKIAAMKAKSDAMDEIACQIKELQDKQAAISADLKQLKYEVEEASKEIDEKEHTFKSSVQAVIDTLNADKVKVNNLNV